MSSDSMYEAQSFEPQAVHLLPEQSKWGGSLIQDPNDAFPLYLVEIRDGEETQGWKN